MTAPAPEPARPLREFEAHFTLARFVVVTAALLFILFPGIFLGTGTFVFRDYGLYSLPIAHHLRESILTNHEIPLWNPASNCGIPFLAQWSTMALYPPALFFVLLPLTWALGIFMMLHLVWAGAGMFLLAKRWTGSGIAATFAGLIFVFNGLTTNCLMWPYYVAVLSWTPWVLLTVERAWREGGRHIFIAALAGAMQMVVGIPEVIAPTWIIAGSLLLVEVGRLALRGDSGRSATGATTAGFQSLKLFVLRIASVVLLVTALAAPQLFPFLDFIGHSQRTTDYATSDWSMPATGWANLLVPLFRCYESPSGVFFQVNQGITSSYYAGILTLVLAFMGVKLANANSERLRVWTLAALALTGLVLALGDHTPVYPTLRKLFPQFGVMRYPVKFMFLTMMVLPLLAAVGLNALLSQPSEAQARTRRVLGVLATIALVSIAALVAVSHFAPIEREISAAVLRNGLLRAVFLALVAGLLVGFLRASTRDRQLVCVLGFLLFTWTDLATHLPVQNPTAEPGVIEPGMPLLRELRPAPRPGHGRAMLTAAAFMEFHQRGLADPAKTLLLQRVGMYDNCNLLEGLAKVDGFWSLNLGWERAVQPAIFLTTNSINPALADFLGVTHMTSPTNIFQWDARPTALPLMTAGQRPVFGDWTVALNGIAAPKFNSREVVFLPPEAQGRVTATNRTQATVTNYQFRAHRIEADVTADQPALVVIAQTWYHPWRAYVNDKPTPLWRANHAYQAFEVPAGTSHVRVVYEDKAFRLGVALSVAALLLCLGGVWRWRRAT